MLPLIHTLARKHLAALATATLLAALPLTTQAQSPSIIVASTTSTEQSGLFGHILPQFKQASGIDVKVVALGTGQALDVGRRGDGTWCLCMTRPQNRNSSMKATASSTARSCTTTSC